MKINTNKTKGIIACGHIKTAEAAQIIFDAGGTVFDAALSALVASFVVEPCMTGLGGGGFANMVFADKTSRLLDFFCQTPSIKRPSKELNFYPIQVDYGTDSETFHVGLGSMAVPGMLSGIFYLHENFCKLPLNVLFEPAIALAKNGATINDFVAYDYRLLAPILKETEAGRKVFCKEDGNVYEEGDFQKIPEMADFLDHIANEGKDNFYRGDIAQKIATDCQMNGGLLRFEDFQNYECIVRKPLQFTHNNKTILTNPLPSIGGSVLEFALGEIAKKNTVDIESIQYTENWYECLSKTFEFKKELLQKQGNNKRGSTTHLSLADKNGNAISMTLSNGEGAGYMIPQTGVMMNNMLGESALLPNGFHSWIPNKRLSSMMSPSIVLDAEHNVEIVTGTGGASRIPTVLAQILHLLIDSKMDLNQAMQSPRLHFENNTLNLEPNLQKPQIKGGHNCIQWDKLEMFFGGTHTITQKGNSLFAEGDGRRTGAALPNNL